MVCWKTTLATNKEIKLSVRERTQKNSWKRMTECDCEGFCFVLLSFCPFIKISDWILNPVL